MTGEVFDREWVDGDDSALVDDAVAPLHKMLYELYADFEWAVLQDAEYGEPSAEAVEALHGWADRLREEGVLFGERWEIARNVLESLGAFEGEEE